MPPAEDVVAAPTAPAGTEVVEDPAPAGGLDEDPATGEPTHPGDGDGAGR